MICVYIYYLFFSSLLQGTGAARWPLIKLQLQAEKGSM
jgi:hypothetical protein